MRLVGDEDLDNNGEELPAQEAEQAPEDTETVVQGPGDEDEETESDEDFDGDLDEAG